MIKALNESYVRNLMINCIRSNKNKQTVNKNFVTFWTEVYIKINNN